MKTLFLHIGFGKIGTTSIQEFIIKRGGWLKDNGIISLNAITSDINLSIHDMAVSFLESRQNWDYRLSKFNVNNKLDLSAIKLKI